MLLRNASIMYNLSKNPLTSKPAVFSLQFELLTVKDFRSEFSPPFLATRKAAQQLLRRNLYRRNGTRSHGSYNVSIYYEVSH